MTSYKNSNEEHWLYRYDGLGRRYEKERVIDSYFRKPEKDSWHTNRTFYAGTSHSILAEVTDTENWSEIQTGQKYLLGPGGRAYGSEAFYGWNGHKWNSFGWKNRKYYHYDRLGSVSSISLDKPGLAGNSFEYGPFGQLLQGKHSWSWEHKGSFQKDSDTIGYTGKKIDSEPGNYHFPFREYDPLTAQWTTSDPIKDGELWYGYVANNPIKYIDPLGLEWVPLTYGRLWNLGFRSGAVDEKNARVVNNQIIGRVFENAVGEILNIKKNTTIFSTNTRSNANGVIPDFVGKSNGIAIKSFYGVPYYTKHIFDYGSFYEAKATKQITGEGGGDGQIFAMIDVLSKVRSQDNSYIASDLNSSFLILVSPIDTIISWEVIKHAQDNNVQLWWAPAYIDDEEPTLMKLHKGIRLDNIASFDKYKEFTTTFISNIVNNLIPSKFSDSTGRFDFEKVYNYCPVDH